jgi:hypothetical protein
MIVLELLLLAICIAALVLIAILAVEGHREGMARVRRAKRRKM